jgi:hypothetical protein
MTGKRGDRSIFAQTTRRSNGAHRRDPGQVQAGSRSS